MSKVKYNLDIFVNGERSHKRMFNSFADRDNYQDGFRDAVAMLEEDENNTYTDWESDDE